MVRNLLKLAADTMDMQVDVLFDYSWYKGEGEFLEVRLVRKLLR